MVDVPSDELFGDVKRILYQRGHKNCTIHRVYGPGDPGAAFDSFGNPATTALFVDPCGDAKTALIYAEPYVKTNPKDSEDDVGYRTVLIVRDGWLAVVE